MILMIIAVVFLGLEGQSASKTSVHKDANKNAIYAIVWALLTPLFFTFKAYIIRTSVSTYKSWDLGIDSLIFEQLAYCLMYGVYVS